MTGSGGGSNGTGGSNAGGAGEAGSPGANGGAGGGSGANSGGGAGANGGGGGANRDAGTARDAGMARDAGIVVAPMGDASTAGITCTPTTWDAAPIGWAAASGGTTGGGNANATTVTTLAQFNSAAAGGSAAVIHVSGTLSGSARVGSNKTIIGLCGAAIHGAIDLTGSSNVVMRNLTIVGNNCTDNPSDCSGGADAVHVESGSRHLWFDHLDISDGSDGNLDISHAADFITVSWTKFHYSTRRTDPVAGASGHRFCNLIGHDDANAAEDTGHLNVTFHHVWWADNIDQRMPRVRFGQVHVFNSLYTSAGNSVCIELGVDGNIRSENNVFQGVRGAVDTTHSNAASILQSIGNQGSATNVNAPAFTPPYAYTLDSTASISAAVMAGAVPSNSGASVRHAPAEGAVQLFESRTAPSFARAFANG